MKQWVFLALLSWKLADCSKLYQQNWIEEDEPTEENAVLEEVEESEETQGEYEGFFNQDFYEGQHNSKIEVLLQGMSEEEQRSYHKFRADALEEVQRLTFESRQRAMLSMEAQILEEAGEDGVLVVKHINKENPCKGVGYLHKTFVHMDHKEATFVCLPCSASCKSDCYGPGREHCDAVKQLDPKRRRPPVTILQESTNRPFSHSFHEAFLQQSARAQRNLAGLPNITGLEAIPDEMLACMESRECSVYSSNQTEFFGDLQFNETTAVITALTPDMNNDVDITDAQKDVQKAWDQAIESIGLIPGVRKDIDQNHSDTPEYDDEVVDGTIRSDPIGEAAGSFLQEIESVEFVESQEASCGRSNRSNRSGALDLWQFNQIMQGKWKDLANFEAKMAAKEYAKSTILAWLNVQDGPCISAIDSLMGVMMRLNKCYDQITAIKVPICAIKSNYVSVRDTVQTIYTVSGGVSTLAKKFNNLPYIGPFAQKLDIAFAALHTGTEGPLNSIKNFKKSAYGSLYEDWDCCYPSFLMKSDIKAKCDPYPGRKHRCGGCDSGSMCKVYRTCNSFYVTEMLIDDWGKMFMLPMIGAMAQKAQNDGPLKTCGFDCNEVKKISDTIVSKFEASFLNQCPLKIPGLSFPEITALKGVEAVVSTMDDFMSKLNGIMDKQHCVDFPVPACETRHHCWNWCISCPGWGRRRRWSGFRWRSCCGRTCIPYPHCWINWKQYCFSARSVIEGITGALEALFAPILAIVEEAIDVILTPVKNLLEGIVDAILSPLKNMNLDIGFPDISDMMPNIPGLDTLTCSDLQQLAR